jgi:hypothetical protein
MSEKKRFYLLIGLLVLSIGLLLYATRQADANFSDWL